MCAVGTPLLVDVSPPQHFFFLLTDLTADFPEQPHSYSMQVCQATRKQQRTGCMAMARAKAGVARADTSTHSLLLTCQGFHL